MSSTEPIPEASVIRLPIYLRTLIEAAEEGVATLSSGQLARSSGINSAKIRKDLSYLGSHGTRGVGYDVEHLITQISAVLGLTQEWATVLVGAGNLGQALANYGGFARRGFRMAAILDADPAKVGAEVADQRVRHLDDVEQVVRDDEVSIAILAVPAPAAQPVADRLVAAGITSILNFAPAVITVPPHVQLRKVDLAIELQVLSYYEQRRRLADELDAPLPEFQPSPTPARGVTRHTG